MLIKFGGQCQNSGLSAHNLMASAIEISAAHGVINTDETNQPPPPPPSQKTYTLSMHISITLSALNLSTDSIGIILATIKMPALLERKAAAVLQYIATSWDRR